jgi:hypothetical protein
MDLYFGPSDSKACSLPIILGLRFCFTNEKAKKLFICRGHLASDCSSEAIRNFRRASGPGKIFFTLLFKGSNWKLPAQGGPDRM